MAGSFIGRIKVLLGLDSGQFQKGVNKSQKQMSGFQKFSKGWAGKMTGILAGAFAVGAIVDFGKEAVRLAGEMKGVKAAFEGLNDPNLLNDLRAATKGTVSDLELMKNAVKAKNLGVPIQKLGTFFEFARRRAKETGESVQFLTESIVTGIGRKSVLIMDNLGISASELSAEFKKTGDFGVAAGNIVERELKKMGADLDTTAESTARLTASWENYMTTLGSQSTGIINTVTKSLNELLTTITETDQATANASKLGFSRAAFSELDATTQGFVEFNAQMALNAAQFAQNETSVEKLKAAMSFFKQESEKVNKGTDEGRVKLISYAETMKTLSNRIKVLSGSTKGLTEEEKKAALEARNATLNIDSLKDSVKGLKIAAGSVAISDLLEDINKESEGLSNAAPKDLSIHVPVAMDLEITDTADDLENGITNKMLGIAEKVNEASNGLFTGMADAMVDSLSMAFEGASAEDIGKSLLGSFAGLLGSFGKMLITLGIGMEAFKTSLSSLNPAVAIGAGIALIATASAIKGFLKSSSSGGGGGSASGVSSGGGGVVRSGNGDYDNTGSEGLRQMQTPSPNDAMKDFQFTLRGKDLVATTNRFQNTNKLTTG